MIQSLRILAAFQQDLGCRPNNSGTRPKMVWNKWKSRTMKECYEMLASEHDTAAALALPVQINIPAWTEEQPMRPTP